MSSLCGQETGCTVSCADGVTQTKDPFQCSVAQPAWNLSTLLLNKASRVEWNRHVNTLYSIFPLRLNDGLSVVGMLNVEDLKRLLWLVRLHHT